MAINVNVQPQVVTIPPVEREILNAIKCHIRTIASFMSNRGANEREYCEAHAALETLLNIARAQGLLDRPQFVIDCIVLSAVVVSQGDM